MRLRAGFGLLCLGVIGGVLGGCQHLPEGVKVDLQNRVVEVGPCRCALPGAGNAAEPAVPEEPPADAPR